MMNEEAPFEPAHGELGMRNGERGVQRVEFIMRVNLGERFWFIHV